MHGRQGAKEGTMEGGDGKKKEVSDREKEGEERLRNRGEKGSE